MRGLIPAFQYNAQVSADGGRTWSPLLRFTTSADTTPPAAPTDLSVEVQGSSFLLNWTAPSTDANGEELKDFNDYSITVYPTDNPAAAIEQTTKSTSFEFTILQNRHFFGAPQGNLTFEVRARDLTYNRSTPATATGATTPPVAFNDLVATAGPRAIKLSWANQGMTTFYRVYRSATSTISLTTPLATVVTESTSGVTVTYWDIPPDGEVYYYQVVAVDAFGNTANSNVVSAQAEGGIDTNPPATPGAPTVVGGIHSFTVTQTISANDNARFIQVHASSATGFVADETNFIGTMVIPEGFTTITEKFIWVVPSDQPVHVRTIATNGDGFSSVGASPEASDIVKLAGGTYIADAAIGNAHIQEVSASKLMADTAINKNLNVTALLKMGTGGVVESGNYTVDGVTGKPTAGWRLTDTTLTLVGSGRFIGTVEADAGWLSNLTVRSNLTVGDASSTGAVQSYNYNGSTIGWKINSSGFAEFRDVLVRGTVQGTSGYLQSMDITGQLTINGGSIYAYYGANRYITMASNGIFIYNGSTTPSMELRTDGTAVFRGAVYASSGTFSGDISAATGTFTGTVRASKYVSSSNSSYEFYLTSNMIEFRYGGLPRSKIDWSSSGALTIDAIHGMSAVLNLWGDYIHAYSMGNIILETSSSTGIKHKYGTSEATVITSLNYGSWVSWKDHGHDYASSTHGHTTIGPMTGSIDMKGYRIIGYGTGSSTVYDNQIVWRSSDGLLYRNSSTRKLKHDIKDIGRDIALNKVKRLRPRSFRPNDAPEVIQIGFITEEVGEVDADLISHPPDGMGMYKTESLVAILTGALQELESRVGRLEKRPQ